MDLPKVTIIVPVYNSEIHLRECLNNLVMQTYKNIEIICVDDGSIDSSLSILKKYSNTDPRITVISQDNMGVSCARNAGLAHTHSEYVMFCDSDDYYEWNTVELCVNEILSHKNVDGVLFNAQLFSPNGTVVSALQGDIYDKIPHHISCKTSEFLGCFINVCFGCFSMQVINRYDIRFNEGRIYEDWDFMGHFTSKATDLIWINCVQYHYRWNQEASISKNVSRSCLDIFETLSNVRQYYQESGRWENVQFAYYIRALNHLEYFKHKNIPRATMDVQTEFDKKLADFIQELPYEFLIAVLCHIPVEYRIEILQTCKDPNAAIDVRLCQQQLLKGRIREKFRRIYQKLKHILMAILPAYRVSVNTRYEMEQLYSSMTARMDYLLSEQRKILNEVDMLHKKLGIDFDEKMQINSEKMRELNQIYGHSEDE